MPTSPPSEPLQTRAGRRLTPALLRLLALSTLLIGTACGDGGGSTSAGEEDVTRVHLREHQTGRYSFSPDEGGRVDLEGLPPGAWWDFSRAELVFRPDFIQGDRSWTVRQRGGTSLIIEVSDTIQPPDPEVAEVSSGEGYSLYRLKQTTDAFLDSPGHAGRNFKAYITVPDGEGPFPVRVHLHGFSPAPETLDFGSTDTILIHPQDLSNTYWWGYSDQLPLGQPANGAVPPYTLRRALHLLEWTLTHFGQADEEQVWVQGESMGGAGAATLGLLHARHFAWVDTRYGQMIAANHRARRIEGLSVFWGTPQQALRNSEGRLMGIWDLMDLSRVLHDRLEARNQYLVLKHSKDDRIIHFGAVSQPSRLTGESFYTTLQSQHVGHLAIWDEGGHLTPDPRLPDGWWDAGWDPIRDPRTFLRRGLAFPAFTRSNVDGNPGAGKGNNKVPWHARSGFANDVAVAGDTGWDGDPAGVLNRFLRWDSTRLVDDFDSFSIPLGLAGGEGQPAASAGLPPLGDWHRGLGYIAVDVTPRRTQRFRPGPGEQVRWTFGDQSGVVEATNDGTVTVPALHVTDEWRPLELRRDGAQEQQRPGTP